MSPNTSPAPICQPISCLISTFISCRFYKPRLWSVSNTFSVMFRRCILGEKFEMNLWTWIELKECFSICFVVKYFCKLIEKSSWNSRLTILIWIIKTFKAYLTMHITLVTQWFGDKFFITNICHQHLWASRSPFPFGYITDSIKSSPSWVP